MNRLELPSGGRRYLQIAQDLADRISRGDYKAGDKLPPERELASQLQVSRTTVREALLALEIMRFVEIRVGSGVVVLAEAMRDQTPGDLIDSDEIGPWEVLEARRIVEGHTAFLAASRISDAHLLLLESNLQRMAKALDDVPRFDAADQEFHRLIAQGTENNLLVSYIEHLWQMRQSALWVTWYGKTRKLENRKRSLEDHRSIYHALKRRDASMALTAMQAHLDVLAGRFFELKL